MIKTIVITFLTLLIACGSVSLQNKNSTKTVSHFTSDILDSNKTNKYTWLSKYDIENMLVNRIPCPDGFVRTTEVVNSYADWLRHLPMLDGRGEVKLYNGSLKKNQSAHHAIINIDVGNKDLQQCADAVMRLRAEFLFSQKQFQKIKFTYTSGNVYNYKSYCEGFRWVVKDNKVSSTYASPNIPTDRKSFMDYMQSVFNYCGTLSLSKELKKIEPITEIRIGDVFILGGSPGHAVIVVDMAENKTTGDKVFLIAQSYMPAQQMHVLINPNSDAYSPWYSVKEIGEGTLFTPEWDFAPGSLMRFND